MASGSASNWTSAAKWTSTEPHKRLPERSDSHTAQGRLSAACLAFHLSASMRRAHRLYAGRPSYLPRAQHGALHSAGPPQTSYGPVRWCPLDSKAAPWRRRDKIEPSTSAVRVTLDCYGNLGYVWPKLNRKPAITTTPSPPLLICSGKNTRSQPSYIIAGAKSQYIRVKIRNTYIRLWQVLIDYMI